MSNPFHTRSFGNRFADMGDRAEAAFTRVHPKAQHTGLLRPEFSMSRMDARLRYAPDYTLPDGLYEVQGFSSRGDGCLKTKLEKTDALQAWRAIGDVHLWVYDSHRDVYWEAELPDWMEAFHAHATVERFADNGRAYWKLHYTNFPGMPADLPVELAQVVPIAA